MRMVKSIPEGASSGLRPGFMQYSLGKTKKTWVYFNSEACCFSRFLRQPPRLLSGALKVVMHPGA